MNIKEMTDKELQETFMELWENIERTEVWFGGDYRLKEAIGHELENRGYQITEEANVAFIKEEEQ